MSWRGRAKICWQHTGPTFIEPLRGLDRGCFGLTLSPALSRGIGDGPRGRTGRGLRNRFKTSEIYGITTTSTPPLPSSSFSPSPSSFYFPLRFLLPPPAPFPPSFSFSPREPSGGISGYEVPPRVSDHAAPPQGHLCNAAQRQWSHRHNIM